MRTALFLLLIIFFLSPLALIAQPGGGPPPDPGPPVPFEGLGILLAMGAWLGIRKLKGTKKEES